MKKQTDLFKKYSKPVFVETGSFTGDGIHCALSAGIKKIYSIEIAPHLYNHCKDRFKHLKKVSLVCGDSSSELSALLSSINEECLFWLDGHWSKGITGHGQEESPLLKELDQISQHHIKTHTILIDDLRCWDRSKIDLVTNKNKNFDVDELKQKILSMNKKYKFTYDSIRDRFPNDVLVAYIEDGEE